MGVVRKVTLRDLKKALYEKSYLDYLKALWPIVEPGKPYIHNWHISAIADHLTAVKAGHIKRLIVNMPPRHGKSTLISIGFPTWIWAIDPSSKFLCASYSLQLALRDSRKRRQIIESEWYQTYWPIHLMKDQNTKSYFENRDMGAMLAVSVGSTVTGHGGDYLILDDPHNAVDIDSKKRETALDWYDNAFNTRLNNQSTGAIIVVMQRLHEKDVAGHLLDSGDWVHLNLPAEYEGEKSYHWLNSTDQWADPRKEIGEPLWPELYPSSVLETLKKQLGSIGYASQFQQTPTPSDGGYVKKSWFKFGTETEDLICYGDKRIVKNECLKFATVDLAITKNTKSDYTVIALWYLTRDSDLFLCEMYRDRLDNPEQIKLINDIWQKDKPDFFIVESVAYQLSIIQQLRAEGIAVQEFKPTKDKITRFIPASIQYEAGKIIHKQFAEYLNYLEHELLIFPFGEHDDTVDVISMAVNYALKGVNPRLSVLN